MNELRLEKCEKMLEELVAITGSMNEKFQTILTHFEIDRIAFNEWAIYWLNTWKRGHVKDNSFWGTYYAPTIVHLIPYFGDIPIDEITTEQIQEYFNEY